MAKKQAISERTIDIIKRSAIEGDSLTLPEQLSREEYEEVAKVLKGMGGKWDRKLKAHVFSMGELQPLIDRVLGGDNVNVKQETQFFPTPAKLAALVAERACVEDGMLVLEPSFGRGALADAVKEIASCRMVYVEKFKPFCDEAWDKRGEHVNCIDFLEVPPSPVYDRVVMNPPFAKGDDCRHVMHAYKMLKPGGILVAIMSTSWTFNTVAPYSTFRKWIEKLDHEVEKIDAGEFSASGTQIATVLVQIVKES